ncbi:ABC transporter substrate-binding protein [Noviherbaspirillum aridicola]|uniref:Ferrichrome ABC transporter substrate-binding protein n=1 Tax=Noviherbaspirillum aridicola TaxID=2849687 RepID=A0ABQ4Q464_9BURK|nr:ABC transporter substrate-binding protein [Noviherbaspirillum aridicola]GIZ51975.1 ferrichrome ABC transporter substrate-binding protein [Noviherbaspirillum aridicola]
MTHPMRTALAALGMLTIAGAVHAGTPPLTDDRGKTLRLPGAATRIAGVSYFAADTALAFGIRPVASSFLVRARSPGYLLDCMDGVQNLGQRAAPNLELMAKARPDLIVAIKRYTEANAARLEQIAPYMALRLETFADSDRSILLMGDAMNKRTEAEKLNADFRSALRDHASRAPGIKPRSYLFLWGSGDAPWAFYNEHMTASVINAVGGVNVAGSNPTPAVPDNTAFEMSVEAMLAADPEVIFIYDYGPQRRFESNPVWRQLKAVKNRRVVYVGDHWIESHGPVARQLLLREAAHHLHPDIFPGPDARAVSSSMLPHCG